MAYARTRQSRLKSKTEEKGIIDMSFLFLVLILLVFGMIMMFSASYANAYYYKNNSFHYISRQLVWALLGLVAMAVASRIDYHVWRKLAWPIFGVTIVLLIMVYFMPTINEAHRWIFIFGQQFQPTEIAKFSIIILFANIISINYKKMDNFWYGVFPFVLLLGLTAGLVVFEPHLSATLLICALGAVLLFVGGINKKWIFACILLAVAAVGVLALIPSLRERAMYRITIWQNPFLDTRTSGFQTVQSLYAIASGGLLGAGIGNSRQKYLFLPEPQNDFVFAIVCEELGFIGALLVILLFILLVFRGLTIAVKARDRFGMLVATGITAQVGIQAVLNIAVVTNTLPNTGISLPFFSYGGTALSILLAEMGVVLSISRQVAMEKE